MQQYRDHMMENDMLNPAQM